MYFLEGLHAQRIRRILRTAWHVPSLAVGFNQKIRTAQQKTKVHGPKDPKELQKQYKTHTNNTQNMYVDSVDMRDICKNPLKISNTRQFTVYVDNVQDQSSTIEGFQSMGVPPNHRFFGDFPIQLLGYPRFTDPPRSARPPDSPAGRACRQHMAWTNFTRCRAQVGMKLGGLGFLHMGVSVQVWSRVPKFQTKSHTLTVSNYASSIYKPIKIPSSAQIAAPQPHLLETHRAPTGVVAGGSLGSLGE